MAKYTVINIYGISGESKHRTPERALDMAAKREGEGWIVVDEQGNQWERPYPGADAVVVKYAD